MNFLREVTMNPHTRTFSYRDQTVILKTFGTLDSDGRYKVDLDITINALDILYDHPSKTIAIELILRVINEIADMNEISVEKISTTSIPMSVLPSNTNLVHCIITHRLYVNTDGRPFKLPSNVTFIDD